MTHIIGKPPVPKGGATFGDRRVGYLFGLDGETYIKETETTARMLAPGAEPVTIAADTPVRPAAVHLAEPEPDPAVTTYGEAEPAQRFAIPGGLGTLAGGTKTDAGWVSNSGCHYEDGDEANPLTETSPVRRVAASVVEHGELGHNEAGIGVSPSYGDLHNVSLGHGNRRLHREELEELVRRVVAYLAWLDTQQAASPESGKPKCSECKSRGYHHRGDGLDEECETCTFHDGPPEPSAVPGPSMFDEGLVEDGELVECPVCGKLSAPGLCHAHPGHPLFAETEREPAEDRSKPVVDQERRTYSFPMAEPAEDQSKPAPEWRLHKHLPGWYSTCRNGYVVGPKHATEADAIAYTHTDEARREYAQQAGKGGES